MDIEHRKKTLAQLLDDPISINENEFKLHEVIDSLLAHISTLDDDEVDRKGLTEVIVFGIVNSAHEYKVKGEQALEMNTTDDVYMLYCDIYNGLSGGRFAMWYQDALAVYNIASIPGNYLEFGTAHGGSAIMASKVKKEGRIYCVDPLYNSYHHVIDNFNKFGVDQDRITLIRKMTPPVPDELDGLEFSAVLIDADHTGQFPMNEWLGIKDKVIPGGYVMFHDIHRKACYAAYQDACNTPGWKSVALYSQIGHGFDTAKDHGAHGIVQRDK